MSVYLEGHRHPIEHPAMPASSPAARDIPSSMLIPLSSTNDLIPGQGHHHLFLPSKC